MRKQSTGYKLRKPEKETNNTYKARWTCGNNFSA